MQFSTGNNVGKYRKVRGSDITDRVAYYWDGEEISNFFGI
jgi:hypothetical protein